MTRRLACLVGALLCLSVLAAAPAALAAPAWVEIDSVGGQILDVDSQRILFRQSADTLALKDRATEDVTVIPAVLGEQPLVGFLSPHGAIFATSSDTFDDPTVYEWRDGSRILLGSMISQLFFGHSHSLTATGNFAIWGTVKNPGTGNPSSAIMLRDLAAGTTVEIPGRIAGEDTRPAGDVTANGDVYFSGGGTIRKYSAGVTTDVTSPPAAGVAHAPRTDGTNVVWRTRDGARPGSGSTTIAGSYPFPSAPVTLAPSEFREPHADVDYRVAGGWTAFTRGQDPSEVVWVRDPAGTETAISAPGSHFIVGLDDSGQVIYGTPEPGDASVDAFLGQAGEAPIPLGSVPVVALLARGWADHVFAANGRWYNAAGGSLRRLSLTGAPTDGADTTIETGPGSAEASTSATFTFSSTVSGATFQTRLDGGPWEDTAATSKTYDSLAQGQHTFVVRSVAPGGDVDPEPATQTWSVDTVAPGPVTLDTPAQGGATADRTPAFGGGAGTAAGDQDAVLRIYAGTGTGGTPVQTLAGPRSGSTWAATPATDLSDGTYTAQASQSDSAGNTSTSAAVTFEVDATPPLAFALSSPADGAENRSPSLQLRWEEASDAGTGVAGYELWIDGQKNRDVATSSCSAGSCAAAPQDALAEGDHTWQVKALDGTGNTRSSETRDFTVDAGPPSAFSLLAPADGARTGDSTPALSWESASDAGAGVDHYDVWIDDARVATDVTGTGFTVAGALGDGSHSWRVDAVDGAGNVRASGGRTFAVDTTAPDAYLEAVFAQVYTGETVELFATRSSDPDGGSIVRYEWDLDGDGTFELDTGASGATTTTYAAPRDFEAVVRVTDSVGHTDTSPVRLFIRARPPEGLPGVSIENGARFTNDPEVMVDVVWPPFARDLVISNDGGFRPATTLPVQARIPWTLDSSGSERIPKTIYVRFIEGQGGRETYQDDIILDETAPQVLSATMARAVGRVHRVRVKARDRTSGVTRMQLALNRRFPRPSTRYRRVVKIGVSSSRLFVRVRDRAGNWSRWKRVARG